MVQDGGYISDATSMSTRLNLLGKQGWEFVETRNIQLPNHPTIQSYYILKRPLPEKKATTKKTTKKT